MKSKDRIFFGLLAVWGMDGSPLGPSVRWIQISSDNYDGIRSPRGKAAFVRDFKVFVYRGRPDGGLWLDILAAPAGQLQRLTEMTKPYRPEAALNGSYYVVKSPYPCESYLAVREAHNALLRRHALADAA